MNTYSWCSSSLDPAWHDLLGIKPEPIFDPELAFDSTPSCSPVLSALGLPAIPSPMAAPASPFFSATPSRHHQHHRPAAAAAAAARAQSPALSATATSPPQETMRDIPADATYNDLSEVEVATMDLALLERICENSGFNANEIKEVKAHRRKLKNRMSARDSSSKRRQEAGYLQVENDELRGQMSVLQAENQRLTRENIALHHELTVSSEHQRAMADEISRLNDLLSRMSVVQHQMPLIDLMA